MNSAKKTSRLSALAGHLRVVRRHRRLVRKGCFRVGLYWQGCTHDLSKYSPTELIPAVRYYQGGKRSPIGAEKRDKGYSDACLHHKGRNRHHFEYWTDWTFGEKIAYEGIRMPPRYLAEMLIDRICAAKVYQQEAYAPDSALRYTLDHPWQNSMLHPDTLQQMISLYTLLAEQGEDAFFAAVRRMLREGY